MMLKCIDPKCGNEWDYKGNKGYATCTGCQRKYPVEDMFVLFNNKQEEPANDPTTTN